MVISVLKIVIWGVQIVISMVANFILQLCNMSLYNHKTDNLPPEMNVYDTVVNWL